MAGLIGGDIDLPKASGKFDDARRAWYYAEERTRNRNWDVALRPLPDGRVEVVETCLGATIGFFPPRHAKTWHAAISEHVNQHKALPTVRGYCQTGFEAGVVMPDGGRFAVSAPASAAPSGAAKAGGLLGRLFGR